MRLRQFAGGAVVVFLELLVLLGELRDLAGIFLAFLEIVGLGHLLQVEFVSGSAETGEEEQEKQHLHEEQILKDRTH